MRYLPGTLLDVRGKSLHSMYFLILDIIEWYSEKFVLTLYLVVNSIIVKGTFIVPRKSAMVEIPLFSLDLDSKDWDKPNWGEFDKTFV